MNNFRYAGIEFDDFLNGKGVGIVLFMQYCTHHCKGCHNPETWDKNGGMIFTDDLLKKILNYFQNKGYATRLTLSGGDPLDNIEFTYMISKNFKEKFPNHELWIYTGYTFENVLKDKRYFKILQYCDILIDGEFLEDERDISLKFRGSKNQRIINVQKSLQFNKIIKLEE